jgi:SSS family solute:Na+ symporter
MIPALVVFLYLAVVLYIGIFAFRTSRTSNAEDYFLAGRSLGPTVFLLSLFGTNMTAFSILGASGHAFANGIVTFGLMASSSALVIPVCLFAIGTRLWALGKRNHFMTPVQMFRDRWECRHIGTVIFIVQAALLVPYIIISVMGGGTVLRAITGGVIPYEIGGAIVSAVVTAYVFLGGMRGTAWVNALADVAVSAVRDYRSGRHRRRHGRLSRGDGGAHRIAGDVAAADARTGLARCISSATHSFRCRPSPFPTSAFSVSQPET